MPSIVTAAEFPIDSISFGKHKPNQNSGYDIELTFGNLPKDFLLQTPRMKCPFGLSVSKHDPNKRMIDLSFQGIESSDDIKRFHDVLTKIDEAILEYVCKNSKTFFKKEMSREFLSESCFKSVRVSAKEQYADTIRCKILYRKPDPVKETPGKFITTFWNTKREEQPETYLEKWDNVSCLLRPSGIWVANKSFGISWSAIQVQVKKQEKTTGFAFKKTEESDDEEVDDSNDSEELKDTNNDTAIESEEEEEVEIDE